MLPALDSEQSRSTRYVSLLLLLVTIAVTLGAAISTLPANNAHLAYDWLLGAAHVKLLELLCLLAVGQGFYLFLIIERSIKDEIPRLNDRSDMGWEEVAYRLAAQERHEQAQTAFETAYDQVERIDPDNIEKKGGDKSRIGE